MSTSTEFVDGASFDEAMRSVRDDSTENTYLVVGHVDDDPNRLTLITTGNDVMELAEKMDDGKMMYALGRYETTYDMSNTVKFVYFHWVGDKVPYVKKGRYGVVHGSVEEKFSPSHLSLETSNREDFNKEKILQQLEENSGKKSKVIESIDGRQQRGFTQSQLPQRGPAKFSGPEAARAGAKVEIDPEVQNDIQDVRNDSSDTRWLLAEYQDNNPKLPIVRTNTGCGDAAELSESLADDKVMYGFYRVSDTVDDITTVKFVFITWIGSTVKAMTKAKSSTHKGILEETFGPFHVAIFATDRSEVSEHNIMDRVTSASGTRSNVK